VVDIGHATPTQAADRKIQVDCGAGTVAELLPHVLTLLDDFGSSDSFLDYVMDVKEELRDKGLLQGFDEDAVTAELMANPQVKEALKKAVLAVVGAMTYMEDEG
jgi:hypothetical protein